VKKVIAIIFILFAKTLSHADCLYVYGTERWSYLNSHKIIIYRGSSAVAVLEIPYCNIYSSSGIRFLGDDVCNWGKIIVDDEVCDVREVESL